jgi:capsular polysaccharide transport system ATP-binding protein
LILLEHIWKSYGRGRKAKDVLTDVNATLDFYPGNIGILGSKKSGKTTLLNIIAGAIQPDHGRVKRRLRVSWPLSWRGFSGSMTGDAHVAFLARLYQTDRREALRFVAELSQLGRRLYDSTRTYSPREKDRLIQAVALALDFDAYLVDEAIPTIEPGFSVGYAEAWQARGAQSMQIVFTSDPEKAAAKCSRASILQEGQLTPLMPIDDASRTYAARQRRMHKPKRKAHAQRD